MHTIALGTAAALLIALSIRPAVAEVPASRPAGPADGVGGFLRAIATIDTTAIHGRIAVTNAGEDMLCSALARACSGIGAYEVAMRGRFGEAARGKWGVAPESLKLSIVNVTADAATVAVGDKRPGDEVGVIRQNGVWKVGYAGVVAILKQRQVEPAVPNDEPLRRLNEVAAAMRQTALDIRDGQHATATAAADAAKQTWTAVTSGATS